MAMFVSKLTIQVNCPYTRRLYKTYHLSYEDLYGYKGYPLVIQCHSCLINIRRIRYKAGLIEYPGFIQKFTWLGMCISNKSQPADLAVQAMNHKDLQLPGHLSCCDINATFCDSDLHCTNRTGIMGLQAYKELKSSISSLSPQHLLRTFSQGLCGGDELLLQMYRLPSGRFTDAYDLCERMPDNRRGLDMYVECKSDFEEYLSIKIKEPKLFQASDAFIMLKCDDRLSFSQEDNDLYSSSKASSNGYQGHLPLCTCQSTHIGDCALRHWYSRDLNMNFGK